MVISVKHTGQTQLTLIDYGQGDECQDKEKGIAKIQKTGGVLYLAPQTTSQGQNIYKMSNKIFSHDKKTNLDSQLARDPNSLKLHMKETAIVQKA